MARSLDIVESSLSLESRLLLKIFVYADVERV
jgi:hypothetical protein